MRKSAVPGLGQTKIHCFAFTAAVALASASAHSAAPTESATEPAELEQVIVTANKVSEPVQRVAQTVNVVSGEMISDLNVQNIIELTSVVGGLSLTMTSPSEQSISLRGIKMVNGTPTSNTVESYLNEVPISTVDAFSSTLDIGQVEVLKGPQGTLRGRPSPSGAITISTKKGSFTDYEGYAAVTGSDHDGSRVEGAFGGPIADTWAFRVAGLYDHNGLTEVKDIAIDKSNFQETSIGRATLDWAPNERFSMDAMLQYTHQTGDFYRQVYGVPPCAGSIPPPFNTVSSVGCGLTLDVKDKIALNTGPNPNHYYGTLGTVTARFGLTDHLDLNYVGGYNYNEYYTNLNFDFAGVGAANFLTYLDNLSHTKTFSNELRLQSVDNEVYNFTYGGFASNVHAKGLFNFPGITPGPIPSDNTTKDYGLFTNQRISFGAKDEVQVGLRYSSTSLSSGREYNSTTGNASYQHQFTDDLMAYVSYGTAYRPGSGNTQNPPVPQIPRSYGNFEEENSESYEAGVKSQWFDHRVTANLAIFSQKYDGYISQLFNVACTGVPGTTGPAYATIDGTPNTAQCFGTMRGNGDAVSKGIEFELQARLAERWTIGLIYTYTDAHYSNAELPCNDYNSDGVTDTNGTPRVQQGQYVSSCALNGPLGSLPKVSFTANVNYDLQIGTLPAYIRANTFTRSSSYFPQTGTVFSGYTTVNTTIGIMSPERKWDFSLWAKNLFDEVNQDTDGGSWNVGPYPSGVRIGTVTNDREVGLTARYNF